MTSTSASVKFKWLDHPVLTSRQQMEIISNWIELLIIDCVIGY